LFYYVSANKFSLLLYLGSTAWISTVISASIASYKLLAITDRRDLSAQPTALCHTTNRRLCSQTILSTHSCILLSFSDFAIYTLRNYPNFLLCLDYRTSFADTALSFVLISAFLVAAAAHTTTATFGDDSGVNVDSTTNRPNPAFGLPQPILDPNLKSSRATSWFHYSPPCPSPTKLHP
jgi:hypothetical protein